MNNAVGHGHLHHRNTFERLCHELNPDRQAQAAAGFAQINAIRSATFGGGGSSPTPSGGSAVGSSAGNATNLTNANAVGNTAADMSTRGLRDVNISVQGFQITTDQFRDIMTGLNEVLDDGGRIGQINVVGGSRL